MPAKPPPDRRRKFSVIQGGKFQSSRRIGPEPKEITKAAGSILAA